MNLSGKKIAFLGDSITEGVGAGPTLRFSTVFCEITNAIEYNYGISGTRLARQIIPTEGKPRHDLCFLDRVEEMVEDPDVVVVFGGTNDFGHGDAPFGNFNSVSEYTFYGAVHSLVKRIINRYPDKLVVFMTPLHRTSENAVRRDSVTLDGVEYNGNRPVLLDFVNAIKEVCEYYSIPVLDLYSSIGIQPCVPIQKEMFMPDGLHPSPRGAEKIAKRLAAFLRTLM